MGNENEIKKEYGLIKSRFLPRDIPNTEEKTVTYDLEKEFEKTRKSRNPVFFLVLLSFLAFVIGVTLTITSYLNEKFRRSDFALIENYSDLRLKDILAESQNLSKRRDKLKEHLVELEKEHLLSVSSLKEQFAAESSGKSEADIVPLQSRLDSDLTTENEKYEKEKAELEKELKELEEQIALQERQVRAGAGNVDRLVDNAKKLNSLQLQKQAAEYEDKIARLILLYNPKMTEREVSRAMARVTSEKADPDAGYSKLLGNNQIMSQAEYSNLRSKIDDQKTILARMKDVPYKNSVPRALSSMESLNASIANDYQKIYQGLTRSVEYRDGVIRSYRFAIIQKLRRDNEGGYILDAQNDDDITIILHPALTVKNGDRAIVFRGDDEEIARIEIISAAGGRAKVLSKKGALASFDKILLETQGDTP